MGKLKSLINKIKASDAKATRKFNVDALFPGYVKKFYFRMAFLLIGVLVAVMIYQEGLVVHEYTYTCPSWHQDQCYNPLYACSEEATATRFFCDVPNYKEICEQGLCDKEYLYPGETLGRKPGFIADNFMMLMFGILLLAFFLNHLDYHRRTGNWQYEKPTFLPICAHEWKYWWAGWVKMRTCKHCWKREKAPKVKA